MHLGLILLLAGIGVMIFQNCNGGFRAAEAHANLSATLTNPSPSPLPSPAPSPSPSPSPSPGVPTCSPFNGSLKYVVCDVKRSLSGDQTPAITETNYQAILNGLKNHLGCNAIRVYIDPTITDPGTYPTLYKDFYAYAHDTLGLKIYANPLGTGNYNGLDKDAWAAWIINYANHFQPEFIGPFNESALNDTDFIYIADKVKAGLQYPAGVVGVELQKISSELRRLGNTPALSAHVDILGSHNAVDDQGATSAAWSALQQFAGKATWASENPRPWSLLSAKNQEIGVKAVVTAPIEGLVIYLAYPTAVDASGVLTTIGADLAQGLLNKNCAVSTSPVLPVATVNSCASPALAAAGTYQTFTDLTYKTVGGTAINLDLYVPNGVTDPPLIVQIHGGAWAHGDKSEAPEVNQARVFAGQGYAVAMLNYRLLPNNLFPSAVQDVRCAVKWLKSRASTYHFAASHVGVIGHSAGAHLAAMLGTTADEATGVFDTADCQVNGVSPSVQAIAAYYAPTDFADLATPPSYAGDPSDTAAVYGALAGLVQNFIGVNPTLSSSQTLDQQASPASYTSALTPPFFLVHGTADLLVPGTQLSDLLVALTTQGIAVNHFEISGLPHGFYNFDPAFNATLLASLQLKNQLPASLTADQFERLQSPSNCTLLHFLDAALRPK